MKTWHKLQFTVNTIYIYIYTDVHDLGGAKLWRRLTENVIILLHRICTKRFSTGTRKLDVHLFFHYRFNHENISI